MSKFTAIVLAAGSGSRMHSEVKKQYMELEGYPLIYYALKSFSESPVDDIILVTGLEDIEYCRNEIVMRYGFVKVTTIVAGGKERYDSVYNGLNAAIDADYVLIHDGARPFVTDAMIRSSMDAVVKYDAVTVAVPTKDTIKVVDDDGFGVETLDRSVLWNVQTPQSFNRNMLLGAYKDMRTLNDTKITDDTVIIERYANKSVKIIEGDYRNIKVTTPEDINLAKEFLRI